MELVWSNFCRSVNLPLQYNYSLRHPLQETSLLFPSRLSRRETRYELFARNRRTPSCFVDFVAEVLCPLLAGVPLFLAPDGAHADPLLLVPYLVKAKVTRITLTPSLLASLLRTADSYASPLLPDLHVSCGRVIATGNIVQVGSSVTWVLYSQSSECVRPSFCLSKLLECAP